MMHVLSSGRQVAAGILLVGTQISNGSAKVGDGVFERFPAILLLLPGEFVLANGRLPLTVARQIKLQFLGSSIKFGKAVFGGCQLLAAFLQLLAAFLQLLAVLLQHTLKDSLLEVLVARIYLRLHPLQVLLEFLKRCCGACIGRCCGQ